MGAKLRAHRKRKNSRPYGRPYEIFCCGRKCVLVNSSTQLGMLCVELNFPPIVRTAAESHDSIRIYESFLVDRTKIYSSLPSRHSQYPGMKRSAQQSGKV